MRYARYDDIVRPTWTVTTGTERTGYTVANLGGAPDPSLPVWITGTSIDLRADLGSAHDLGAIALINHTFDAALNVRFQANSSSSFVSPAVDVAITIEAAYLNGFACHAVKDITALLASYRYVRVYNATANGRSVAIGDIILATSWRTLSPSIGNDYQRDQTHLVSRQTSKRGVQTVYDMGARERGIQGTTVVDAGELDTLLDWCDEQHQSARPMLIQLDAASATRRHREPHLCRFSQAKVTQKNLSYDVAYEVALQFEELGCGELVGA